MFLKESDDIYYIIYIPYDTEPEVFLVAFSGNAQTDGVWELWSGRTAIFNIYDYSLSDPDISDRVKLQKLDLFVISLSNFE